MMELIIRTVNARTLSILPRSHCLHGLPLGAFCYFKGRIQVCQVQKSLITLPGSLLYISSLLGYLRQLRDKFCFLAPCRLNTGFTSALQMGFILEVLVSEHREQNK